MQKLKQNKQTNTAVVYYCIQLVVMEGEVMKQHFVKKTQILLLTA